MIWFGNVNRILPDVGPEAFGPLSERERMQRALEWVAERAPQLSGASLLDALHASGWVDRDTAARLMVEFRHFDADRHFADSLRRLSFKGPSAAESFRRGVGCIVADLTGTAEEDGSGPEPVIRFRSAQEYEGAVIAHPEVSFTIAGKTREAIESLVEEMPDSIVVVARNFERTAADQLSGILSRTGVPGTLVTLNLLLGIRAVTLRYQPPVQRVLELLGAGRPVRSRDVALLGNR
jgi:hypothetical protein